MSSVGTHGAASATVTLLMRAGAPPEAFRTARQEAVHGRRRRGDRCRGPAVAGVGGPGRGLLDMGLDAFAEHLKVEEVAWGKFKFEGKVVGGNCQKLLW